MIHLNIKPEERPIIVKSRYTQPYPRVMQKYDALHLLACGLSNKMVCSILGICNNTALSFFKHYMGATRSCVNDCLKFYQRVG